MNAVSRGPSNTPTNVNHSGGHHHGLAGMTGFGAFSGNHPGLSGAFVTPVKATSKAKSSPGTEQNTETSGKGEGGGESLTKIGSYWQFSSPGGPLAASLGLLPDAGVIGWTPGMNGIVGSDSPVKRR